MIDCLDLFEKSAKELSKTGKVFLAYVTAELQPFSSQRKPDIILSPNYNEDTYFVEYLGNKNINDELLSLKEKVIFSSSDFDREHFYYFIVIDTNSGKKNISIGNINVNIINNVSSHEDIVSFFENEPANIQKSL